VSNCRGFIPVSHVYAAEAFIEPSDTPNANGNRSRNGGNRRFLRVLLGQLIVQNHVQQRSVNSDAAVVFDKFELAKAVQEEADDLGNQRFRFSLNSSLERFRCWLTVTHPEQCRAIEKSSATKPKPSPWAERNKTDRPFEQWYS
jgi:hypothetical protein